MRLWQVDAFTSEALRGNPAAVCRLDGPGDAEWMQKVAAEMNLSETAFFWPEDDAATFGLRWFTPLDEVPLCGHMPRWRRRTCSGTSLDGIGTCHSCLRRRVAG